MARAENDRATFPPAQFQSRRISEIYGFDAMNSLWRRVAVDPMGNLIVNTGGDIVEDDDNDIADGQTTGLEITIGYIHDGTSWIRQMGGLDNAPAAASPQGTFIAGIARVALPVYADGDVVIPAFDTSGRLIVSGGGGAGVGTTITTPANTAVGIGATVALAAPPVGTTRMTVQNKGPAGTFILVREVGAGAGTGILLGRFSSVTYGGPGGAIEPLEAEDVSLATSGIAVATTVVTQFEGP